MGSSTVVRGRAQTAQQVIIGSHIYLFAGNNAGYGSPSVSLLNPAVAGVSTDAAGAFVTTDAQGIFSLYGLYSCAPGQLVYILALGGRPGAGTTQSNSALAMMSVLGSCPASGNFVSQVPFININEVSTIASVYALSGFMADAVHVSSSRSAASYTGMTNAFAAIGTMIDIGLGTALPQTPEGTGILPRAKMNTLANMLVPCVNASASAAACTNLFSLTKSLAGVAPTDTIAATLNMARNPGGNVGALFAQAANTTFTPSLAAAPNDLTLAITFFAENMAGAYYPAIDSAGNLWVPGYANNSITIFDSLGNILSGDSGITGGGLSQPFALAIDGSDNAWVSSYGGNSFGNPSVAEFSASGTALTSNAFACGTGCSFLAIDSSQNVWVSANSRVTTLRNTGASLSQFATGGFSSGIAIDGQGRGWTVGQGRTLYRLTLPGTTATFPETATSSAADNEVIPVALDASDNVWFAGSRSNALGKHDRNGSALSPSGGYTGGGLNAPSGMAIDGDGRVWIANRNGNSVSAFTNDGVAVSPATGLKADGVSNPRGVAVDLSGNVWITNFTGNSVTEFLGAGAPTAAPLSPTRHGVRP